MEQGFIDILKKLTAEQGKQALLNPAKAKAFLADYVKGEYKKESRLLLQSLELGAAKAIDSAADLALCKQQQIRALQDECFLVPEVAADLVDTLALVLRGDASKTQAETPQTAPPKPGAAPQERKTAKPGLTKWKEYRVRAIAFDTEIEITGYKGLSANVQIPSHIEGLPVTAIGDLAFNFGLDFDEGPIGAIIESWDRPPHIFRRLASVSIPVSVTHIGNSAFYGNKLIAITIPNSVTYIGDNAFAGNRLTSIIIPNSVTHIGNWAFMNNQLNSVSIPDSVTAIGAEAFADNKLISVSVPGKANIVKSAFDKGVKITRR